MTTENDTQKTSPGEGETENPTSARDSAQGPASAPSGAHASLNRFASTFESSARRWEMIVYPSMFAFIMLAAYGFFLIYSVTSDMHNVAKSMDPAMHLHMKTMANSIAEMTKHVATITTNMNQMTANVESMDSTVGAVSTDMARMTSDMAEMSEKIRALEPMLINISEMNRSIHVMNQSVHAMAVNSDLMSRDIGATSYHFVRPMSAVNSFFPW